MDCGLNGSTQHPQALGVQLGPMRATWLVTMLFCKRSKATHTLLRESCGIESYPRSGYKPYAPSERHFANSATESVCVVLMATRRESMSDRCRRPITGIFLSKSFKRLCDSFLWSLWNYVHRYYDFAVNRFDVTANQLGDAIS